MSVKPHIRGFIYYIKAYATTERTAPPYVELM